MAESDGRERRRQEALANRNKQIQKQDEEGEDDLTERILQVCAVRASASIIPKITEPNFVQVEAMEENEKLRSKEILAEFLAVQRVVDEKKEAEDAFDPLSVDDTDNMDNPLEHAAWKLRELKRIQQEQNHDEMVEEEQAATEVLETKSKYRFLQKYYHKGAFYTDDAVLKRRDYGEAVERDRIDRDTLPSVLQVRDFGKRGKSKWTHLTNEDTTVFDYGWGAKANYDKKIVSRMAGQKKESK